MESSPIIQPNTAQGLYASIINPLQAFPSVCFAALSELRTANTGQRLNAFLKCRITIARSAWHRQQQPNHHVFSSDNFAFNAPRSGV
jgi:hypothetical protein